MMVMIGMAQIWVGLTPTVAPVVHLLSLITPNRPTACHSTHNHTYSYSTQTEHKHSHILHIHLIFDVVCKILSVSHSHVYIVKFCFLNQNFVWSSKVCIYCKIFSVSQSFVCSSKFCVYCKVLSVSHLAHWAALTLLAHSPGGLDATMPMMTTLLVIWMF